MLESRPDVLVKLVKQRGTVMDMFVIFLKKILFVNVVLEVS